MRVRDEQLYYLKRRGYERSATRGDIEVWARKDDPEDIVIIQANPPMSEEVRVELVKELERLVEQDRLPGDSEAD